MFSELSTLLQIIVIGLWSLTPLAVAVSIWVVRIGKTRTPANARQVSRRCRLISHICLILGPISSIWLLFIGLVTWMFARRVRALTDDRDDELQIALDRLLGSVAFCGWGAVMASIFLLVIVLPIGAVLLLLLILIALPLTIQLARARQQCQLLWTITVTVRSGRELNTELRRHASCWIGNHAASVRQFAHDLEAGLPLGDAMLSARENSYLVYPRYWRIFLKYNPISLLVRFFFGPILILPAWVIAAVQTGEKTGTLEKTLAVTSKQYLDSIRTRFTLSNVTGLTAYLVAYLSIAVGVVSFLMVFIMPKFKAIFDGFGTELPDVSETVIAVSDFAASFWYVFVILGIFPLRLLIRLGIGEPLAWKNLNSKVFARFFPRLDAPDVLRQLCAVIQSGRPLTTGLRALSESHQRDSARVDLLKVLEGVESGKDCWALLADAGYLRHEDLQLLRVAINAGNLPWALEELASSRERSLEHRLKLAVSFVEPAVIIAFGLLCGFIIIGFFMPVAKLVNDLS